MIFSKLNLLVGVNFRYFSPTILRFIRFKLLIIKIFDITYK